MKYDQKKRRDNAMKYHIGKLIDGICQERSLDREKIYGGLCDKRTFQKIEQ